MKALPAAAVSWCALLGCAVVPGSALITASAPNDLEQPGAGRLLHILHVRSTSVRATGFPIGPSQVITAAHVLSTPSGAAAVESRPMVQLGGFGRFGAAEPRWENDWVALWGTRGRFAPNIIDPNVELRPGDKVLIGGFFVDRDQPTDAEYWTLEPSVVEGTIVELPWVRDELAGLVWALVPAENYRGFSGGPVAHIDSDGNPRVWGVFVYQLSLGVGPFSIGTLAGNVRLPADQIEQLQRIAEQDLGSRPGKTRDLQRANP